MTKAFWRTAGGNGFLAGTFQFGRHGDRRATVKEIVHDGDTVNVATDSNFPIRFLGIDTPEISYSLPGTNTFRNSDDPVFQELLETPFADKFGGRAGFSMDLCEHIEARASATAAVNHHAHAESAERKLEELVQADLDALGGDREAMKFFLAFAYEALDFYGRLLCYIHLDQSGVPTEDRKPSYNEQMLATGVASPYFIFPNVDPFRAKGSPIDAARDAGSPQTILAKAPKLRSARQSVKDARAAGAGIFAGADPLLFEAFEFRYLSRHKPPSRWLIDLSGDERVLYHPQSYYLIPNTEDRLWVPEEFVPLFEAAGWMIDDAPNDYA